MNSNYSYENVFHEKFTSPPTHTSSWQLRINSKCKHLHPRTTLGAQLTSLSSAQFWFGEGCWRLGYCLGVFFVVFFSFGLFSSVCWFYFIFLRIVNMTICSRLWTLVEPVPSLRKATSQFKVENWPSVNAHLLRDHNLFELLVCYQPKPDLSLTRTPKIKPGKSWHACPSRQ